MEAGWTGVGLNKLNVQKPFGPFKKVHVGAKFTLAVFSNNNPVREPPGMRESPISLLPLIDALFTKVVLNVKSGPL